MLYFKVGYINEIHYYYRSWMEDDNLGMDNRERSNVCWAQRLYALCSPWTRSTEMAEEMQNRNICAQALCQRELLA